MTYNHYSLYLNLSETIADAQIEEPKMQPETNENFFFPTRFLNPELWGSKSSNTFKADRLYTRMIDNKQDSGSRLKSDEQDLIK